MSTSDLMELFPEAFRRERVEDSITALNESYVALRRKLTEMGQLNKTLREEHAAAVAELEERRTAEALLKEQTAGLVAAVTNPINDEGWSRFV